ncbi:hypothetical protein M408DRAFT_327142 [Serendipita vermifera MAFF 305830]|uniref:Uncharacterized protein n=1 Tax=Serendipita vermifera MAFF 305830 TaxID=933852 RepID=A0A0C3BJN7_SERVB|nr:hypothetical protein M408DRAFT_327142 [Serendipita vermifera MAFF 305830]
MWIAHFAPGLALKRMAPDTPLALLSLAGALPDALFMVFAILGIETIKYSDKSQDPSYRNPTGGRGSGCFPYDCDYPYTHSITGEIIISLAFAVLVTVYTGSKRWQSFLAVVLAGLTHPLFDLAVHRHDVALTPSEPPNQRHGFPLFDYPIVTFVVDLGIFLGALYYHLSTARVKGTQEHRLQTAKAYVYAAIAATLIQADFAFFGAPTTLARAFHAPLFLGQILAISWGCGLLDVASEGAGGLEKAKAGKAL